MADDISRVGCCTRMSRYIAVRKGPTAVMPAIGWSDVTVICDHSTISMLWGNTSYCLKLSGEDSSRYWNKIETVALRKCPYSHCLTAGLTVGQWVMGHGSPSWIKGSTNLDGSRGSRVSTCDPLTHDPFINWWLSQSHISTTISITSAIIYTYTMCDCFTVISLVTFIWVMNRLLVRPNSCHRPQPNFIATEILSQYIMFSVSATGVQTIVNNHNS